MTPTDDENDADLAAVGSAMSSGDHVGYRWMAGHNGRGHRCGFIRVPSGHPWHGKPPHEVGARVHGGLNWSNMSRRSRGYWLGFECNLDSDAPDLSLPMEAEERERLRHLPIREGAQTRTQEYVENECRSLCAQAAKAAQVDR